MMPAETITTHESTAALFGPCAVAHSKKLERFFISRGLKLLPASEITATAQAGATSRLVKGSKFPTRFSVDLETGEAIEQPPEWEGKGSEAPGAYSVLSYRAWDDTYRLRPQVDPRRRMIPTPQVGPRLTDTLTRGGRTAIDDSARFLASIGKGFTTMATFTLRPDARERTQPHTIEGDYSDLTTRQAVEYSGRYCVLQWHQGELIPGAEIEGTHTLKPVTTVQQELSRALDAMQKIYQRGFQWEGGEVPGHYFGHRNSVENPARVVVVGSEQRAPGARHGLRSMWPRRIIATTAGGDRLKLDAELLRQADDGAPFSLLDRKPEPLRYLWVAEAPTTGDFCDLETRAVVKGRANPHIHMLMDWLVPYEAFRVWADRIEGIWGHGFVTLEKLHTPEAAGAYVLKAAKYVGKGQDDAGQGWIVGNRYFISRGARAPQFEGMAVLPHGQLNLLLEHAADHQKQRLEPLRRMRQAAREAVGAVKNPKAKGRIIAKLKGWQKAIEGRPIIAGRFQILFRGFAALLRFCDWAAHDGDQHADALLPSKPAGFAWAAPLDGAGYWRTTPTADVVERRGGRRWWRQRLRMPVFHDDDLEHQRHFFDRWEPVTAWQQ